MSEAVEEKTVVEERVFTPTAFLYATSFLLFILPIKFGSSWIIGDMPSFPLGIDLFIGHWPSYFLTIISTGMLIGAIAIYRPKSISKTAFYILLSWFIVGSSCAFFGYYPENIHFYYHSVNQIVTVVVMVLLISICVEGDTRSREYFLAALCAGLLYTILAGLYQYFWGFRDTVAHYQEQVRQGVQFAPQHASRIMQKLVFSTFTISNSFAAHIILVLPLLFYFIAKKFNNENQTVRNALATSFIFYGFFNSFSSDTPFVGIITLIIGFIIIAQKNQLPDSFYKGLGYLIIVVTIAVLFLTRSRAGIVCLFAGTLFSAIFVFDGKYRKIAIGLFFIGTVAAFFVAPKVASFQVRLGYYEALLNMFFKEPMGYGFGSFSEVYNQTKGPGIEESNIPHSFFFGYLGQGGAFAGLAVITCFILSFYRILKSKTEKMLKFCILAGFTNWFFHAQLDFNIMIIGSLTTVAVLGILTQDPEDNPEPKNYSLLFTALFPITFTILYFSFINARGERKFAVLNEKISDQIALVIPAGKYGVDGPSGYTLQSAYVIQNGQQQYVRQLLVSEKPDPNEPGFSKYFVKQPLRLPLNLVLSKEPPIDEIRNDIKDIKDDIPYSTGPLIAVSRWAMKSYQMRKGGDIIREEYLTLAKETHETALKISPNRSSIYGFLANVHFYKNNFEETLKMLTKTFELYPFSPSALQTERIILEEYLKREPRNVKYHELMLRNSLKKMENTLGQLKFSDHLGYSANQLKSLHESLDKQASTLYTEIDFVKKAGIQFDVSEINQRMHDIITESNKISGVTK